MMREALARACELVAAGVPLARLSDVERTLVVAHLQDMARIGGRKRRRHSEHDVALARSLHAHGVPVVRIAEKLDVPRRTVRDWLADTGG